MVVWHYRNTKKSGPLCDVFGFPESQQPPEASLAEDLEEEFKRQTAPW